MPLVLVDLLFGGVVAVIGVTLGWWLRGGGIDRLRQKSDEEAQRARGALVRLHDLAARVAADVGEHSSRVEEISEELASSGLPDTETVVSAVDKLVEANGRMQEQLANAEERLQEQARQIECHVTEARTDALTGLANRRAFDDATARCFDESQQSGKTFSTVMIDVDHFKQFNDTHGHQAGDEVLRHVARILRKDAPPSGVVARYGGEEFAIILPGAVVTDATQEAERIRKAIDSARIRFGRVDLHVTVSAGTSQAVPGEDVATTVKRADTALYASKDAGRNCTHWHDGERSWLVARPPKPSLTTSEPSAPRQEASQTPEQAKPTPESPSTPPAQSTPSEAPTPASTPQAESSASEGVVAAESIPTPPPTTEQAGLCDGTTFCTVLGSRLAEWRRGGLPPSVLLVHVDDYKSIVAHHGTLAGSRILRTTMQFLRAAIREMDLVAHYEDTVFAVLLPCVRLGNAVRVAERLRQAIARCTLPVDGGRVQPTVSIGGAEASGGDDTRRLLDRAQEALSASIKVGGNSSYFHNGQQSNSVSETLQKTQPPAS